MDDTATGQTLPILKFFRHLRRRRILDECPIGPTAFRAAIANVPLLARLPEPEREKLRRLATLFLHEKIFESSGNLALTEAMKIRIAALACLPILHLDLDWYAGWRTVVVFPTEFVRPREAMDDVGVMHEWEEILGGEAWDRGPVILSWADVEASGQGDGYNVVIHEMAHKLDMLNGPCDGFPPLHRGMRSSAWAQDFTAAFEDFNVRLDRAEYTPVDPYAGESPSEFFAVLSEYFFERPALVHDEFPAVYAQMCQFYRTDPLQRTPALG
ncbi:zinc-dependent peptidase [Methylococcus capsulatus]|uniref:M90 family metallopeptidase n=1 Tax=Methylococcus capsulatus TaxID=414 RepID=UPI001C52B9CE|nr:M90 family metallopeptidase [Methylococcus capsulatus]QXP88362.1 zinc-dependent peptidase [Methylococcus capsulatus]UQN13404.1 zinc-dependent peptidase [Methylococcus capsulatus]